MNKSFGLFFVLILFFFGCSEDSNIAIQLQFEPLNVNVELPVDIQNAGDGSNRLFIASQKGIIYSMPSVNSSATSTFLDISSKVYFISAGSETGLLGLAFDPNFKSNGYIYVNYNSASPLRNIISRFTISSNPDSVDVSSELEIISIMQPYANHNGGQLAFGPDNLLYISFGDGGNAGDPEKHAQNLEDMLGSIIRIDVSNSTVNAPYTIPQDNPFVINSTGYREEIFAYGLRNVWRFSFDKLNGDLWAADVGQNEWEEINIIEKGKNYGWNIMEGFHCYNPSVNCDQTNLELPIFEYGHQVNGGYSITGGYVYRGGIAPELNGKYIYGDYVSGAIWALNKENNYSNELIFSTNFYISTFGQDENNELYFASYLDGKIYRLR